MLHVCEWFKEDRRAARRAGRGILPTVEGDVNTFDPTLTEGFLTAEPVRRGAGRRSRSPADGRRDSWDDSNDDPDIDQLDETLESVVRHPDAAARCGLPEEFRLVGDVHSDALPGRTCEPEEVPSVRPPSLF